MTYPVRRPSSSRHITLRGLRYHVRSWGGSDGTPLVLLHGWMDVSASFQFVVDAFVHERAVLAPDWRGFGLSDNGPGDCYWFPDYLADLEILLDALVGDAPVILVGHSMGGNVAMMYAGIRPSRVRAVINLEGFGLRDAPPERAPARFAQWIDELKSPPGLRDYASLAEVAARLRRTNPRLSPVHAEFLAPHWSVPVEQADGSTRWRVAGDPAHRLTNPVLYRWAEVQACWQQIAAPLLWVEGGATDAHKWAGDAAEVERRLALLPSVQRAVVAEAGHMLHHDQPQAVARLIEAFIDALPG
jgi:pimeloyl-ACP methyl ester carboxylesterase